MDIEYVDFINEYYEQAKIVYSDMKRETGEDYILHPINVAYILAELKMDPVTIGCALIHEAITLNKMTYEEIEEMFGSESAIIVSSVTKISNLKQTFKINNSKFNRSNIFDFWIYIKYKSIFKYDIKNNTFNNNNICSL